MKNINKNYVITFACGLILTSAFALAKPTLASEITSENVVFLINKERLFYGDEPVVVDPELQKAADLKSSDMITRNYFEHYAFGLSPWDFIHAAGYDYLYAGENLAMSFDTSEGMVNAWMNSPAHRANILNPDFQDLGVGVVKGAYTENGTKEQTIMVTNMFARRKPAIVVFFEDFGQRIASIFGSR